VSVPQHVPARVRHQVGHGGGGVGGRAGRNGEVGDPCIEHRGEHVVLGRVVAVEPPGPRRSRNRLACRRPAPPPCRRRRHHPEAAWLFGAADAVRQRGGLVRFKIFDAFFEFSAAALRDALGEKDFESTWAEGAALSTVEAIAYAQRRRGERKRPSTGWASLTPTERDVVRLVSEGLANNDVAARLCVSPRTVQTHLTHVYSKLGSETTREGRRSLRGQMPPSARTYTCVGMQQ
jgi:DNA-binding CsgD family transcriptional regulator